MNKIPALEELLKKDGLVSGVPYDNPTRQEAAYFQYIREYASLLGFDLTEERQNFKAYFKELFMAPFGSKSAKETIENAIYLVSFLGYPILGGDFYFIVDGEKMVVGVPSYAGITRLIFNPKLHEYNHALHYLMAQDMMRRGLLTINGFSDVPIERIAELRNVVLDFNGMKAFERKVLTELIKAEKKVRKQREYAAMTRRS